MGGTKHTKEERTCLDSKMVPRVSKTRRGNIKLAVPFTRAMKGGTSGGAKWKGRERQRRGKNQEVGCVKRNEGGVGCLFAQVQVTPSVLIWLGYCQHLGCGPSVSLDC